ncbi:Wee1-like protein kinase [Tetrabaena socialis]|uniref:Wee1-like protein kinase n=1 Tax=Tetrabaena socialis TaxID=47790 RepID=A0A2J8A4J4_9CHLO|nr:Wee1-like protein kinase [Tetrabaena socialis]|eukprot:PNH07425.1 Wee1-like protein kinase [Tetrabaena socialis]
MRAIGRALSRTAHWPRLHRLPALVAGASAAAIALAGSPVFVSVAGFVAVVVFGSLVKALRDGGNPPTNAGPPPNETADGHTLPCSSGDGSPPAELQSGPSSTKCSTSSGNSLPSEDHERKADDARARGDGSGRQVECSQQPQPKPQSECAYLFDPECCSVIGELGRGAFGWVEQVEVMQPSGAILHAARETIQRNGSEAKQQKIDEAVRLELDGLQAGAGCEDVVQVFGSASFPDRHEIFMEVLEGGSLKSELEMIRNSTWWRRNKGVEMPLKVGRIKEIATSLFRGLAFCNANGIVPLDIKPANIVFTAGGRPVLCDLGSSCRMHSDGSVAPGHHYGVGAKTDVFSAGVVLLQCAAWPDVGPVLAHVRGKAELPACVPVELCSLLEGLLAKDPVQRLSAEEGLRHPFLQVAKSQLSASPVIMRAIGDVLGRAALWPRLHRSPALVAGASAAAIALAGSPVFVGVAGFVAVVVFGSLVKALGDGGNPPTDAAPRPNVTADGHALPCSSGEGSPPAELQSGPSSSYGSTSNGNSLLSEDHERKTDDARARGDGSGRQLGRGAFGVVERVEVRQPSGATLHLARKTIQRDGSEAQTKTVDEAVRMELDGLQAGAGCEDIVQVFGSVSYPDRHEIFMELLEGDSLKAELEIVSNSSWWFDYQGLAMPLKVGRIKEIATAIFRGLAYCNANGIVPLDIKPANIVSTTGGRPVLCDLGSSCRMYSDGSVVSRGGSLAYMSPEMKAAMLDEAEAPGHRYGVGARTDVFSAGVVLLQCAAWPDFKFGPLVAHVRGKGAELPACVPAELRSLLEGLLAKDPAQRLSAEEALRHPFLSP